MDLLAIPALIELGRSEEINRMWQDTTSDFGSFGSSLIGALAGGESMTDAVSRLAAERPELFADVDGQMLLKALGRK